MGAPEARPALDLDLRPEPDPDLALEDEDDGGILADAPAVVHLRVDPSRAAPPERHRLALQAPIWRTPTSQLDARC